MGVTEELAKPLDAKHIADRRAGQGKVSYIESHHAIREANRIFGFDGWTRETCEVREVQTELKDSSNGKQLWYVGYTAKVVVRAIGVVREGTGFGQGQDGDLGKAHESAIKEAESDAMKRALMTFGDPFGLALYDKTQEHVEKTPAPTRGRSGQRPENVDEDGVIHDAPKPYVWTGPQLVAALKEANLKMNALAPILGESVDTQNYVRLIDTWLAEDRTRKIETLIAAAKAPLPPIEPVDLGAKQEALV